ncbi:MAG TPA: oligosaccharide flippase family protein, partial [Bacillota bacterium]|nr:oligosaccharide flippase family protein [Bacillota bacterium]
MHIFSTSVLNKIIGMLTNAIIVRLFTKAEYGNFTYAYNLVTTIMVFSSLGINASLLQYGCEISDSKKRLGVEKALFLIGFASNFIFSLCTLLYAIFIPLSTPTARTLLIILSFIPLFQFVYAGLNTELRILRRNKDYARVTNIQTIAYFLFACAGAGILSTIGTSIGRYCGYIVPILLGVYMLRENLRKYTDIPCERKIGEYMKFSLWVLLTNDRRNAPLIFRK